MHRLPRSLTLRQQLRPTIRTLPRRIQRRSKSQIVYNTSGEAFRYQSVRFKSPGFFSLRRIATFGLYTGTCYAFLAILWRRLDIEFEIVEGDEDEVEQEQAVEGEEEAEEEGPPFYAEEDSLFIPLTWSHALPRTYYKGSDPEWQSFIVVSKDQKRHKQIMAELLGIVRDGCASHPAIARQLGKDVKLGKHWLDISFPEGPPQEYERSGIEIGDGFVAWSQQKVSQENQWRLMRALWPSAAAQGTWATVSALAGMHFRKVKQLLGWEGVDPNSPEARFRKLLELQQLRDQQQQRQKSGKPDLNLASSTPTPTPVPQRTSAPDGSRKLPWLPAFSTPSSSSAAQEGGVPDPTVPIAMHVFSSTLAKSWFPKKALEPPRGAIVVSGMVEIRGARGRMLFDVVSAYHPEKRLFEKVTVNVRERKEWKQRPRGGN